jgi:hypothetical protein
VVHRCCERAWGSIDAGTPEWLRDDGLDEDGEELFECAPGHVRRRRARGESPRVRPQAARQQNDEKMDQNVRSCGTIVKTWRPFEADQAFQTFEAELDVPPQAVEVEDILCREVIGWEGGQRE